MIDLAHNTMASMTFKENKKSRKAKLGAYQLSKQGMMHFLLDASKAYVRHGQNQKVKSQTDIVEAAAASASEAEDDQIPYWAILAVLKAILALINEGSEYWPLHEIVYLKLRQNPDEDSVWEEIRKNQGNHLMFLLNLMQANCGNDAAIKQFCEKMKKKVMEKRESTDN